MGRIDTRCRGTLYEDGTRINLYIEGDLHTELSARAAKERRTLNEVMAQAIREYLGRNR